MRFCGDKTLIYIFIILALASGALKDYHNSSPLPETNSLNNTDSSLITRFPDHSSLNFTVRKPSIPKNPRNADEFHSVSLHRTYDNTIQSEISFGKHFSFDGESVAIGASRYDAVKGIVIYYNSSDTTDPLIFSSLYEQSSSYFGNYIAQNDEWIVVGQPNYDGTQANAGAVVFLSKLNGESSRFKTPAGYNNMYQGTTIATTQNYCFVTAPGLDAIGRVTFYILLNYTITGNDKVPPPTEASTFGSFLYADDDFLFVCDSNSESYGAVFVYTIEVTDDTTSAIHFTTITASPRVYNTDFGDHMDRSDDGKLLAITAPSSESREIYIFEVITDGFAQIETLVFPDGDVSFDKVAFVGSILAVSCPTYNSDHGAVFLFSYDIDNIEAGFTFYDAITASSDDETGFGYHIAAADNQLLISTINNYGVVYHYLIDGITIEFPSSLTTEGGTAEISCPDPITSITDVQMSCTDSTYTTTLPTSISSSEFIALFEIPVFVSDCVLTAVVNNLPVSANLNQPQPTVTGTSFDIACNANSMSIALTGSNFGPISTLVTLESMGAVFPCNHSGSDPHNSVTCEAPSGSGQVSAVLSVAGLASDEFKLHFINPIVNPVLNLNPVLSSLTLSGFCLGNESESNTPSVSIDGDDSIVVSSYTFSQIELTNIPILNYRTSVVVVTIGDCVGTTYLTVIDPLVTESSGALPTSGGTISVSGSFFGSEGSSVNFTVEGVEVATGIVTEVDVTASLTFLLIVGPQQGPGLFCVSSRCTTFTLNISAHAPTMTLSCLSLAQSSIIGTGTNFGWPATHVLKIISDETRTATVLSHTNDSTAVFQFGKIYSNSSGNNGMFTINVSGVLGSVNYELCSPEIIDISPQLALPEQSDFLVKGTDLGFTVFDVTIYLGGVPLDSFSASSQNVVIFEAIIDSPTFLRIDREGLSTTTLISVATAYVLGNNEIPSFIDTELTICSDEIVVSPQWGMTSESLSDCTIVDEYCALCTVFSNVVGSNTMLFYPSEDKMLFSIQSFIIESRTLYLPNIAAVSFSLEFTAEGLLTEPISVTSGVSVIGLIDSVLSLTVDPIDTESDTILISISDSEFSIGSISKFSPVLSSLNCLVNRSCQITISNWTGDEPEVGESVNSLKLYEEVLSLEIDDTSSGEVTFSVILYESDVLLGTVQFETVEIVSFGCVIGFSCEFEPSSTISDAYSWFLNDEPITVTFGKNSYSTPADEEACLYAVTESQTYIIECTTPLTPPQLISVTPVYHFSDSTPYALLQFDELASDSMVSTTETCVMQSSTVAKCPVAEDVAVYINEMMIASLTFTMMKVDDISFSPSTLQGGIETVITLSGSFVQNIDCDCEVLIEDNSFTLVEGQFTYTPTVDGDIELFLICGSTIKSLGYFRILPGPSAVCSSDLVLTDTFDPYAPKSYDLVDFITSYTAAVFNLPSRCGSGVSSNVTVCFNESLAPLVLIISVEPFCGDCSNSVLIDNELVSNGSYCVIASESSNSVGLCYVPLPSIRSATCLNVAITENSIAHIDVFGWSPTAPYESTITATPSPVIPSVDSAVLFSVTFTDVFGLELTTTITENVLVLNTTTEIEYCYSYDGYFTYSTCLEPKVVAMVEVSAIDPVYYASEMVVEFSYSLSKISNGSLVSNQTALIPMETYSDSLIVNISYYIESRLMNSTLEITIQKPEANLFIINNLTIGVSTVISSLTFLSDTFITDPPSEICSISWDGTANDCDLECSNDVCECTIDSVPSVSPSTELSFLITCGSLVNTTTESTDGCGSNEVLFEGDCHCSAGYVLEGSYCTACPEGTYALFDDSECTVCPLNMDSLEASTHEDNCSCADGYLAYNQECLDCDALHLSCENSTSYTAATGYLITNSSLLSTTQCPIASCLNNICREGYNNTARFCTQCSDGFFMISSPRCVEETLVIYIFVIIIAFGGVLFLICKLAVYIVPLIGMSRAFLQPYNIPNWVAILISFPSPFVDSSIAFMGITLLLSVVFLIFKHPKWAIAISVFTVSQTHASFSMMWYLIVVIIAIIIPSTTSRVETMKHGIALLPAFFSLLFLSYSLLSLVACFFIFMFVIVLNDNSTLKRSTFSVL